jgi:hypothetical protein
MIATLALIGKKQGYDIWVGKKEQQQKDNSLISQGKRLSEYMTLKHLKVDNAENKEVVENIDLLWIRDRQIMAIFEIESTTSMMSALMRGSNVDNAVDKFMILPEERETQFSNKMTSPLFREHFENENWKVIFFDALRAAYTKEKTDLDIFSIVNLRKVTAGPSAKAIKSNQERLF